MRVLGIETSCDDTAAAVVEGRRVLSNEVAGQDDIHAGYGGIVPELAARRHLESIVAVVTRALNNAGARAQSLDAIAVTRGPGLVGSLLVGMAAAEGLAVRTGVQLIGVNHLEGHVLSPLLGCDIEAPFLALLVSGGHTALYLVREIGIYVEVAATRDDAAGEAFDKAAKMLGLGYPGGRVIDERARCGNSRALHFPRARVRDDPVALSFSGLKTSLWDYLSRRESRQLDDATLADICASFQEAVVDALVDRVCRASRQLGVRTWVVAGGVSANSRLRERMREAAAAMAASVVFPPVSLCTDNAAMIAAAAIMRCQRGLAGEPLEAVSRLPLGPRLERLE